MTPLKAIRKYCLWCGGDSPKEVRDCVVKECVLWGFRMGRLPENRKLTSLGSIRARCMDCANGKTNAALCSDKDCALYIYRNGKNPKRKGMGDISKVRKGL